MKHIKKLKILADKCATTNYADELSVAVHNKNVNKIRKIISEIETEEELLEVLKTKNVSTWGAFQYLETPEKFSNNVINNAKKVLNLLSKENSIEALVAKQKIMRIKKNMALSIILGLVVTVISWLLITQNNKIFWSLSFVGLFPVVISSLLGGFASSLVSKQNDTKAAIYIGSILTFILMLFLLKNGFSHHGRNPLLWYWPIYILPFSILGAYITQKIKQYITSRAN